MSNFSFSHNVFNSCLFLMSICGVKGLPFPKQQTLDFFKTKESADDNFEFDGSGRKVSKRVENTVGKGEIARYEQFPLFPQCFPTNCTT